MFSQNVTSFTDDPQSLKTCSSPTNEDEKLVDTKRSQSRSVFLFEIVFLLQTQSVIWKTQNKPQGIFVQTTIEREKHGLVFFF